MHAGVIDTLTDIGISEQGSILCSKLLSKLGHIKSKVKETTTKELLYKIEGKVQMTKIEQNTYSGKGNKKP